MAWSRWGLGAIPERIRNRVSDEQREGARQGHHGLGSIETVDQRLGRSIGQVWDHSTHPTAQTRPHTSGVRITTGIVLVVFL